MTFTPCLHFCGFSDPQEYWNAVRVFGKPDFVHQYLDYRAVGDFAPGDTVVLAGFRTTPCPHSFDDSNQPDDPAAAERLTMR